MSEPARERADLDWEAMGAAKMGFSKRLREALEAGADWRARDPQGRQPLHAAARAANEECVRVLLEFGADPNETDGDGRGPLAMAARATSHLAEKGRDLGEALLRAGARADGVDEEGISALHWAAKSGSFEFARALLSAGADPNAKGGSNGLRPLHFAVAERRLGTELVIAALIRAGADPQAKSDSGRSEGEPGWSVAEFAVYMGEPGLARCVEEQAALEEARRLGEATAPAKKATRRSGI